LKKQTQVTPQTIFDLASCSKSFTAMAVLLLWDDGLIDLDQPLQHYIPEFQLKDDASSGEITVRQLLNQTSGIPGDMYEPLAFQQGSGAEGGDAFKLLVAAMKNIRTNRPPGSSFEYTNLNYCLLGALVERVSGMPFEDFVQQRIFTPLDMTNSTLKPAVAASLDRADGHQMMLGKIISRNTPVYRSAAPAGWVMSSAEDMGKWLIVNLNDGMLNNQQVIPARVIEQMQSPAVKLIKDGEEASYGMGWFVGQAGDGEAVIWHGGDTSNFLSEMIMLPDRNLGVVMLVNSQTSRDAHSVALGIASLLMGSELELPSSPWWASWAAIDGIAINAVVLSLILVVGLIPYLWWQWRVIGHYQRKEVAIPRVGKTMKILLFVLPVTPWVLLMILAAALYVVAQTIFGFNLFQTLIRFGAFAPPGVMVAAITILVAIFLWALALTVTGFLRASARARA
ncbi:MAG: serine hydrolase, partial [Chloroflexi bacterium]|nr:serine hydrolase [Chloroflexota bacterium]